MGAGCRVLSSIEEKGCFKWDKQLALEGGIK